MCMETPIVTTPIDVLVAEINASKLLPAPAGRRALRVSAGVSLERVGQACGVTRQAVWTWEHGLRTPRGENLRRYIQVLAALKAAA